MPDLNSLPYSPHHRPATATTKGDPMPKPFNRFVPPINFAHVEEGVYRSGQPSAINIPFLETLELKTIVWLGTVALSLSHITDALHIELLGTVEEPNEAMLAFADENELTMHHLGIAEGGNPWDPLTEQCVIDALYHVINTDNFPLLVCCGMGRHRTGTVIGCLRRLQGALEEYRRFTGSRRSRVMNELHIEAFQRESVSLPPSRASIPTWLWAALE
ncbi:MAG: hypothetical protein M1819_005958 [Sarea resinae]|nr:MAG: hypothetical protein M1819_005958 [Sarea resinae]